MASSGVVSQVYSVQHLSSVTDSWLAVLYAAGDALW